MTKYVLGFMFDPLNKTVVLIRKKRPEWQAGLLNGVGGHIEPGELIDDAMVREFREETGVITAPESWCCFCTMTGANWEVYCLRITTHSIGAVTTTDEAIEVVAVNDVITGRVSTIPNLKWLIPLALDNDVTHTNAFLYRHSGTELTKDK